MVRTSKDAQDDGARHGRGTVRLHTMCKETDQRMCAFLGKGPYYGMNVPRGLDRSDSQRDMKKK
jgi:hypothetical protein